MYYQLEHPLTQEIMRMFDATTFRVIYCKKQTHPSSSYLILTDEVLDTWELSLGLTTSIKETWL
jgi:hypothetical protein